MKKFSEIKDGSQFLYNKEIFTKVFEIDWHNPPMEWELGKNINDQEYITFSPNDLVEEL